MHSTSAAGPALVLPPGVPAWVWITSGTILLLLTAVGFRLLFTATRRRREQRTKTAALHSTGTAPDDNPSRQRSERGTQRLVNIAAGICITLYLGLFASSFQAIAGFAREFLRRTGLMVPATPLTLDGVVIGALFLSLAYVAKRKSPAKANALIWGMTIFAAYCGFTYGDSGDHGSLAAGLYYAVMSIVGMLMFHMVLELFQDAGDYIRSKYPSMGWRWITHWSTLPVMLAWINHPPRHQVSDRPTVRQAIDHWNRVRTVGSRARRIEAATHHEAKLVAARRKAELIAARRATEKTESDVTTDGQSPMPQASASSAAALAMTRATEDHPQSWTENRDQHSEEAGHSEESDGRPGQDPSRRTQADSRTATSPSATTATNQALPNQGALVGVPTPRSVPDEAAASLIAESAKTVAARSSRTHIIEHLAVDDSDSKVTDEDSRLPRVREFLQQNPKMKLSDVDEQLASEFRVGPRTVRRLRDHLKQSSASLSDRAPSAASQLKV